MSNWKEFLTKKNVLALLGLVLVAVVLPLATVLVQQSQETRKKAAACPLGASSRSSVRFVNLNGQPISSAVLNDRVRLEVNVGAVDAADVVLGFNNNKLEFDTAFGTNGIQKSSAGGLAHFGNSGNVDAAPGRTDVTRILFMLQRARGATATGGKIATIGFKVKSGVASDTTQVIYGEKTTLALNGEGGHLECGTGATLALNGSGPTATPTQPATGASFSLNPGSGTVTVDAQNNFNLKVKFNSGGVRTKNAKVVFNYDGNKIKCTTRTAGIGNFQANCNSSLGAQSRVWVETKSGATAEIYNNEEIGDVQFQFQGTHKLAGLTFNDDESFVKDEAGNSIADSAPNYTYCFSTGCTGLPTATPTPPAGGPTATPTVPGGGNCSCTASDKTASEVSRCDNTNFCYGPDSRSGSSWIWRLEVGQCYIYNYYCSGIPVGNCNCTPDVTGDLTAIYPTESLCHGVNNAFQNKCILPDADDTSHTGWARKWENSKCMQYQYNCSSGPTTTPNPMGDNAQYLSDDLPTNITPGQAITAHIIMKNTGTTTWRATERFHGLSASPQCTGSNCRWGTSGVLVTTNVAPQTNYEFTLNLTVPTTPGTYDAFWQMVQSGALFGQKGGKRIVVLAAAAPTPTATPTTPACAKRTFPDATGDNAVTMADFQRWKDEFTAVLATKTADFNCDNAITLADFQIWKDYFVAH